MRGACAQPRARSRSPHGTVALVNAPGIATLPATSHTRTSLSGTRTHRHDPGVACSDVAPTRPSSVPTARFSDLYFYNSHRNQPIHRIACSAVATPLRTGMFQVQKGPDLYFYNCCKSLYTGNTSHPVSEASPAAPWNCLLRRGSDVPGVVQSPTCISTTPAGTGPFTGPH